MPDPFPTPGAPPERKLWETHLLRAKRWTQNGEWRKALASLERALQAGADAYLCAIRMAELYRDMREPQEAIACAERAIALAPERIPAYEMLISLYLETGDFGNAVPVCQALIRRAPRHVLAHNALGTAYIQLGDLEAAMRATNTLIRLDPHTPSHHFRKGMLCQRKQEYALASYAFQQALRLAPEGDHAPAALEALQGLDGVQIEQILTLATDDPQFRLKMERDPLFAIQERGFCITDAGLHALFDMIPQILPQVPAPCPRRQYN